MKRFLMMAAVVAGVSVTGLTGSAMAGYPGYGYSNYGNSYATPNFVTHHNGYGGANRGCWGGYRTLPARPVCKPYPYRYGSSCGNNYGGYGSNYGGYFGGFGGSRWNW